MFGTELLSLASTLAPTIYQGILGAKQDKQADAVSPGARPVYKIPTAEEASLNLQRLLATTSAPGYTQAKEDIESTGANSLLQGLKFGNPDIPTAYRNETDALSDLNANNEAFHERQQNNLVNKYSEYAGYQDKEFDLNKMQPYQYALDASRDLKDASNQNTYGALGGGASAIDEALKLVNGEKEQPTGLVDYSATAPLAQPKPTEGQDTTYGNTEIGNLINELQKLLR